MKKTLMTAVAVASALALHAEGYQVNTLSTKQIGMAHTGVGMHLGAESMYFNPAGLGFMDKGFELTGSFNAVVPSVTATVGSEKFKTASTVATPLMFNAAFKIYDNLKAGVSFYTPYGSNIDWTENWPGAVLNQSAKLQVFTVQPTVSWRILPNLSVGAGAMISWGNVDLHKGLVSGATADKVLGALSAMGVLPGFNPYGNNSPVSVNLKGTANLVCGVNVGAMWDINRQWTVGASFRTKMTMKVDAGTAKLSYNDAQAEGILSQYVDVINNAEFTAKMPAPWVLSFGASYKPIDRLVIAADARLTGWSAYKELNVDFLDQRLAPYNQHIEKKYKNSWAVSVGAQYALTDRLDLRAGLMVDTSPVDDQHYNPETPGMTKIEPAVGLSFRPVKNLSIDVAFLYVAGLGVDDASCTYDDLVSKVMPQLQLPETQTFTADYKLHALTPSIGISYSF